MEITEETNNHQDTEMQQNNEWVSHVMRGIWYGKGEWKDDEQWTGQGTWEGGFLSGNWDGVGSWSQEDGRGNWTGKGNLISNISFRKSVPIIVLPLFVILAIFGNVAFIKFPRLGEKIFLIFGLIVIILLMVTLLGLRTTKNGKWSATGTWEDKGEYRILDLTGKWKLGHHEGVFKGKMKDHKTK